MRLSFICSICGIVPVDSQGSLAVSKASRTSHDNQHDLCRIVLRRALAPSFPPLFGLPARPFPTGPAPGPTGPPLLRDQFLRTLASTGSCIRVFVRVVLSSRACVRLLMLCGGAVTEIEPEGHACNDEYYYDYGSDDDRW